jgi:hypothetical protein
LSKEITVSDSNSARDERQDEHQFRYVIIPGSIFELVADGVISRAQAWLLGLIDSLVKTRGEGCWASNAWLAKRCAVSIRQLQRDLLSLRELGLIVDSKKPKMVRDEPVRTLETTWSRAAEIKLPPRHKRHPPMTEMSPPSDINVIQVDTDREGKTERDRRLSSPPPKVNLSSIKIDGWAKATAAKLRRLVTKEMNQISPYKASDWEKEFVRLRASLDGNEHVIDETLDWFSQNWRGLKGRFFSAKSFCKNFTMFLEMSKRELLIHNPKGAPGQSHTQRQKGVDCSNKRLTIPNNVREELDGIEWAKGEPDGLDQFYLETLDAADRLITVGRSVDEDTEEGAVMDNFIYAMGGSPKVIAMRWCRWAAASANAWPKWGGSLKPFRLHPDGNLFKERLNDCRGRCLSGTVNRLIATLKKEWA